MKILYYFFISRS